VNSYRVVEQVGDCTFALPGSYDTEGDAMLVAVTLTVACDEEREFFVDGPGLDHPIGVGRRRPSAN
jgi:hypothetical protein